MTKHGFSIRSTTRSTSSVVNTPCKKYSLMSSIVLTKNLPKPCRKALKNGRRVWKLSRFAWLSQSSRQIWWRITKTSSHNWLSSSLLSSNRKFVSKRLKQRELRLGLRLRVKRRLQRSRCRGKWLQKMRRRKWRTSKTPYTRSGQRQKQMRITTHWWKRLRQNKLSWLLSTCKSLLYSRSLKTQRSILESPFQSSSVTTSPMALRVSQANLS